MKRHKTTTPLFAVCIDNSEYPASLELHKIYRVLPDEDAEEDGDLRVIDESGDLYLYPADYFMMLVLPPDVQRVLLRARKSNTTTPNKRMQRNPITNSQIVL